MERKIPLDYKRVIEAKIKLPSKKEERLKGVDELWVRFNKDKRERF